MEAKITFNPKILSGKPIIQGTRISVDFLIELFASGMTTAEILDEYPELTDEHVRAALDYAAQSIKHEDVLVL